MVTSQLGDLAGRVLAGRYRLLAPIGTGASGRVYAADDVQLRRRVAVKVLHAALADDAGFLRRFRAEAQVAASLHHPNIMTVHDWGEDLVPFMVLELLEGGSLRAVLDSGARLTVSQAAHVGRDVSRALDYAHRRGIVHRDVKPANLLFDEHGVVRIADFGLARALAEASWTEPMGAMFGTARYASPEQALGSPLDARSDLYSLALVLVEAVTGRIPFAADTTIGTLTARTRQSLVVDPALGPLRAVLERAGRVDREERYPDAATMAGALDAATEALPPPLPLPLAGARDVGDRDPTHVADLPTAALILGAPGAPGAVATEDVPLYDQDAVSGASRMGSARRLEHRAVPAPGPGEPGGDDATERNGRAMPGSPRRLVPIVVAIAVALALFASVFAVAGLGVPKTRTVPLVEGVAQADAERLVRAAGLDVRVRRATSDDGAGIVIAQSPPPGRTLESRAAVTLTVSQGPGAIAVPSVVGLTEAEARARIAAAGLVVGNVRQDYTPRYPKGDVAVQNPVAGTDVAPDAPVRLSISRGRAPVAVPNVVGKTLAQAVAALRKAGFAYQRGPDVFSDTVAKDRVAATNPSSAAAAQPYGTTVTISVSKGPDLVKVPRVLGKGSTAACRQIRAAGLRCRLSGVALVDVVIAQSERFGTKVKRNTEVVLTVA